MKTTLGSITGVFLLAAVARAQGLGDPPRDDPSRRLGLGYSYGSGWKGYGYGPYFYGGGLSYGTSPSFAGLFGTGSTLGGLGGAWTGFGGPFGDAGGTGPMGGLGSSGGHGVVDHRRAAAGVAGPVAPPDPVLDRLPDYASAREIEEGRRRLKAGDYHGAVDQFRAAVAAQTRSPVAQAWFAVGLAITDDGRNADKALRAAAAGGLSGDQVSLADAFHDDRERAKVVAALSRMGSEGGLAAAFALSAAGEPEKLRKLAAKDPVARQLAPKP